jgi:hypothetical protein
LSSTCTIHSWNEAPTQVSAESARRHDRTHDTRNDAQWECEVDPGKKVLRRGDPCNSEGDDEASCGTYWNADDKQRYKMGTEV